MRKNKAHEIGHLLTHNNRSAGDHHHSNEDIDDSRTPMNYYFKHGSVDDLKKRLSQVFVMKRKDMTVLGSMVVTLPKDVKDGDERAFFKACYDFYRNDVGQENVINAVVHKDDTVYILGDICHHMKMEQADDLIKKLNGKKYLIKGNLC